MTGQRKQGKAPGAGRPVRRAAKETIRVGVSACLLGQKVRYDGGHKRDDFVAGDLARVVTVVPVCPEVELGLGTPREPIQLRRAGRALRLVAPGSGADHTEAMRRYSEERVSELERLDLSGYVLKKDSPSCGMEGVPVWDGREFARTGRGAFAAVLMTRLPLMPVVEETGLRGAGGRARFLEQVFAYGSLRSLRVLMRGGDRRSIARSSGALALVRARPARVAELAALAMDEDWLVSMRALDLLEKLARDHPEWVEPYKRLFIGALADSDKWEVRLQIVRALPLFTWTRAERRRAVEILLRDAAHPQKFVRAWALDGLATLARRDRALIASVGRFLREFERSGSKALAARARSIQSRLALV